MSNWKILVVCCKLSDKATTLQSNSISTSLRVQESASPPILVGKLASPKETHTAPHLEAYSSWELGNCWELITCITYTRVCSSVADYSTDFHFVATEPRWMAPCEVGFLQNLNDKLKDELASGDNMNTFDWQVSPSMKIVNRLQERWARWNFRSQYASWQSLPFSLPEQRRH